MNIADYTKVIDPDVFACVAIVALVIIATILAIGKTIDEEPAEIDSEDITEPQPVPQPRPERTKPNPIHMNTLKRLYTALERGDMVTAYRQKGRMAKAGWRVPETLAECEHEINVLDGTKEN